MNLPVVNIEQLNHPNMNLPAIDIEQQILEHSKPVNGKRPKDLNAFDIYFRYYVEQLRALNPNIDLNLISPALKGFIFVRWSKNELPDVKEEYQSISKRINNESNQNA
ncbi:1644_t:CDS:1 [Acaulospora morrowiae]|uniref:1644_t:CDS:1 n=1 Tax=Acaulospora morrowiae TaxID=94023 RepID=A0A9N9DQQ1_9GLOM|nr:1644_t:CDS:1 [Acaulospora morrowiae]